MKYEKRVNSDGSQYYSFVFANRKRLTRKEIRNRFGKDILTKEEAEECLKLLQAEDQLAIFRVQKRLAWEKEFYDFKKLLDQYALKQKKSAPNSWTNNVFYMKHYVLYYFLTERKLNNIELWADNYDAFIDWLEKSAKTIHSDRIIAYASKNHAIKSLNTFMQHLYRERILSNYHKAPSFREHLTNRRTIDDVVLPDEMEAVYEQLLIAGHKKEAMLYRFLFFTGMRFNEALAISVGDLFDGEVESDFFKNKMAAYKIEYFGYLVSDSQYGGKKEDSYEVIRLPFKGKRSIEERFNRTIPIIDKVLWNSLIDTVEEILDSSVRGMSRRDMLIFDKIDDATTATRFQAAYAACKLRYRSPHCLRHSRATLLIGETSDLVLARIWLGHSSPRVIEKYNHIYAALTRAAKSKKLATKEHRLKRAK